MKRRAVSLLELLMAMFLLATVTAMMLALLFPSMWLWRGEQNQSEVQQAVLVACSRIEQGLLNCQAESLTLIKSPDALGFQQVLSDGAGFDPVSGNPILESRVHVFYHDVAGRRLFQGTWSKAPPNLSGIDFAANPSHLVRLSATQLRQVTDGPPSDQHVLARHVEAFQVSDRDGDLALYDYPVSVRLRCQWTAQESYKQENYEMTIKVTPRSMRL